MDETNAKSPPTPKGLGKFAGNAIMFVTLAWVGLNVVVGLYYMARLILEPILSLAGLVCGIIDAIFGVNLLGQ
jgi:hypothetical protein